ncbi:hypothetical protein GCM10011409_00220 [Lentibacillus populi]|uniref:Bacteriophage Gp15 protein n=1 Tax=Lentibacillus populi TaxID=1827502 RepID=A0A9W5TTV0_9BACI|nr:Gp15 family bacteriophage protein [Lentibacillus populi]GGB26867.1 hypothetical protein GCM10011409_00220 [Lentibacillus populi]
MRLNDPLVTSFAFEGKEYAIDLSFDNVLDVFDYLNDKTLRDYEKAEICLALLLGDQSFDKAITIDLWNHVYESFIHIESKQPIEYDRKGNPMPVKEDENKNFIDLDKDAEYIFASFQQAYGMNLYREQRKLHWHEFQSLLNGLPSDTIMQRIIQIRMWKPSKGESTEYKQSMRDLQKIYALDDEEPEEVD